MVKILGIETSCDDTAAAIIEADNSGIKILSSVVSSQTKLHAKWGGVVPNLAAREHLKNIIPVLELGLKKARVLPTKIDAIAVTHGPGLIPALLIGTNAAKTLSYVWQKPLIGVHHIEGHIYANVIHDNLKFKILNLKFPALCLVVSGGHTQLILMKKHLDYKIVGETLDDAAGEAFDKVARILGLGYPGGPAIAKYALRWKSEIQNPKSETNTKYNINLPRPMINKNNLDFSFSGLKTAVLYAVKNLENNGLQVTSYGPLEHLCAEFQQAVVDVLVSKTLKAAKIYKPKTIMLAGGVSANQELRRQLGKAIKKNLPFTDYRLPVTDYSIDNAAMIAAAAAIRFQNMTAAQKKKALNNWKILQPDANLKLK